MMKDGAIIYMEPEAVKALRTEGRTHTGHLYGLHVFRDITGLDDRVWQHLLDCAERTRFAVQNGRVVP